MFTNTIYIVHVFINTVRCGKIIQNFPLFCGEIKTNYYIADTINFRFTLTTVYIVRSDK